MKKILIGFALVLFGLVSCSRETLPENPAAQVPEGSKVVVTFSVTDPSSILTRAMSVQPAFEDYTLYVLAFGGSVLKEAVEAVKVDVTADGQANKKAYTAVLTYTENKRYLHFVAVPTANKSIIEDALDFSLGEVDLMTELMTSGTVDAYWQRVEVANILPAKNADGSPVTITDGDYAGNYQLDNSSQTYDKLQTIPLVRNFARILVTSGQSDFTVTGYAVINVPDMGSIAPYNHSTSSFSATYSAISSDGTLDVAALTDTEKYPGYMPATATIKTALADAIQPAVLTDGAFMYERPVPTADATMILVGGKFTGDTDEYWYKVEFVNSDGKYVPICRNVLYTFQLAGFTAAMGEESMEAAYNGPVFGDISSSLTTSMLPKITDTHSTLEVGFMDWTGVVGADGASIPLTFVFQPDKTSSATSNDITVTLTHPNGTALAAVSSYEVGDGVITVNLNPSAAATRKTVLTVSGKHAGDQGTIHRDVTFRVIQSPSLAVTATYDDASSTGFGAAVTVSITLPEELGSSLFPLNFYIESNNDNLMMADGSGLSVTTGASHFNSGYSTFHYVKTVEYADYYDYMEQAYVNNRTYTCTFTTTKADNSGTKIYVTDSLTGEALFTSTEANLQ